MKSPPLVVILATSFCVINFLSGTVQAFAPHCSTRRRSLWKTEYNRISKSRTFPNQDSSDPSARRSLFYQRDREDEDVLSRVRATRNSSSSNAEEEIGRSINRVLLASSKSFENVETATNSLLRQQPLVALAIFIGAGVMVAYMLGMFFLGGYIENWNPVENDVVPYWDDPVLIIERKVGR